MTLKRILPLALTLCILLTVASFPVTAATTGETANGLEYSIENGEAIIIKYNGETTKELIIPSTIDGCPVTTIVDLAFNGCWPFENVTIPDSVTTIGESAFYFCESATGIIVDEENPCYSSQDGVLFNKDKTTLIQYPIGNTASTYTIPDGVTTISDWAFYGCESLTSVTIPNSVTEIRDGAFSSCYSLTNITIPDSVTTIGDSAFQACIKLTSIVLPDSVTTIGNCAFSGCNFTSITVEAGNRYYSSEDGVLFNKDKTTLIQYPGGNTGTTYTIPNSVTTISDSAFSNCDSLANITIPDSVTTIGDSAFWSCDFTAITIPNSVTTIGDYAFQGCIKLTSIDLPDSVTTIGNATFYNCRSLANITIPDSVTTIGVEAFRGCDSLTDVYYNSTKAQKDVISIGTYNTELTDATWHYFDNACDTTCNECGNTREVPGHVYDNACDSTCNECGKTRESSPHDYDNLFDLTCNECGATSVVKIAVGTAILLALAAVGIIVIKTKKKQHN